MTDSPQKLGWVLIWKVILCVHLVAAGFAWWLFPHGFTWSHPRFWSNEVLPWIVLICCIAGLYGLLSHRTVLARFVLSGIITVYFSAAATGLALFPITGRRPAAAAIAIGVCLLFLGWLSSRKCGRARAVVLGGAIAGLLLGMVLPATQRGADPATRPVEIFDQELANTDLTERPQGLVRFADIASLSPASGHVNVSFGHVTVGIDPLLEFTSRSPDRCWTNLAPRRHRVSLPQKLTGWRDTDGTVTMNFAGSESAKLRIDPPESNILHLEAITSLPKPVYSHLNSYSTMDVYGHERLFLSFSPCPNDRIEVNYSQYPTGRPARFAYLDADGVFHVVEASSGEKGPFKELAKGPLPRDEPLTITLYDNDSPVGRITFRDFAAQASTQPSPTAGWGVPENAVEFKLFNDRPDAQAGIWVTLAGTSVGRGWDSVGHAVGVYRNRIEFEVLEEND